MDNKTRETITAVVTIASTIGGGLFANRVGCKIVGDENIKNPIEAIGYLATVVGVAGFAGQTAKNITETLLSDSKSEDDKTDETEDETTEEETGA